jgi:hypothetical protein
MEVEAINPAGLENLRFGPLINRQSENATKDTQAVLLRRAGSIEGVDASSVDLGDSVIAQGLTWQGHELLDAPWTVG